MLAWLVLLAISMNLFVLKQISLFGLNVTASDPLSVGYLLTFNLIQEFFGKNYAKKAMGVAFAISTGFLLLSQFQLHYIPSPADTAQVHYKALLAILPRILLASAATFLCVQFLDMHFFSYLRKKTQGKWLTVRVFVSLAAGQLLDTSLFSFLALYGVVESILDVIIFSLAVKLSVVIFSSPFTWFSKKIAA